MRTPESWLKEIQRLRERNTKHFEAKEWDKMQAIGRKIIVAWAGYHRACEQLGIKKPTPPSEFEVNPGKLDRGGPH